MQQIGQYLKAYQAILTFQRSDWTWTGAPKYRSTPRDERSARSYVGRKRTMTGDY